MNASNCWNWKSGGIRVAEYLTELPPKKVLEQKLHDTVRLARARLEKHRASA